MDRLTLPPGLSEDKGVCFNWLNRPMALLAAVSEPAKASAIPATKTTIPDTVTQLTTYLVIRTAK
jgi:hypothetical protein